jgi:tRNA G37 N-methylase Trm5
MPRPNLSESFLGAAFNISKKGTIIFYYGFGDEQNVKEEIFQEARKLKRIISLLQIRKAGEIGVKKFRLMARLKVLN